MAKKQSPKDFVIGLEENAFSSLEHGIEHYLQGTDQDLKFTVLHVFQALELLLKARLAKAHPLLILQRPEEDPLSGRTVDYHVMLKRLKNLGVTFSEEDIRNLEYLHTTRNSIEHHQIAGNRSDIEEYVARAMKLVHRFVEKQLHIRLKDRISDQVYQAMEQALYSYEERRELIQSQMDDATPGRIKERLNYRRVVCDECGEEAILIPDPTSKDNTVHCFSCDARFYYWICDRCGTPVLSTSRPDLRESDMCDACWNDVMSRD